MGFSSQKLVRCPRGVGPTIQPLDWMGRFFPTELPNLGWGWGVPTVVPPTNPQASNIMNKKKLLALGVPLSAVVPAITCIQRAAQDRGTKRKPQQVIVQLIAEPEAYLTDPHYAALAAAVLEDRRFEPAAPITYQVWGSDIDPQALHQMQQACRVPGARAAAVMPDAHVGYGLPIGGVLATEGVVIPYAVGVDIACRMRLSITDLPYAVVQENDPQSCQGLDRALERGTLFGTGRQFKTPHSHEVLDRDWTLTAVTRENKDRAWKQLGSSGSGNHFVEWGVVDLPLADLGLPAGRYVGLLSHSGSRGTGAAVCARYSQIARQNLPARYKDDSAMAHLAWLDLKSQAGQEYWAAMNLMGDYAAANHQVIHDQVLRLAGAQPLAVIENHHNFAWQETYHGQAWVVHRKGATPAGKGVLGVIPGSMASPCFLVRGKGEPTSLHSASHGAGRQMSRTAALARFQWGEWKTHLQHKNVRLLAGGLDEVPGAYKDIRTVMAAQEDLVETLATFHPRIVMMCGDGSRAED
jgi:tRNA-splicing ligase RtcB (3'-phosphate/5'-hydroxy nucleic acid ligase)